jgi:hypothetical protein
MAPKFCGTISLINIPIQCPKAMKLLTIMQPSGVGGGTSIIIIKILPWQLSTFIAVREKYDGEEFMHIGGEFFFQPKEAFSHVHLSKAQTGANN